MKQVLLILSMTFAVALLSAQTVMPNGHTPLNKNAYTITSGLRQASAGANRSVNSFYVDYFSNEFIEAQAAGSQALYLPWDINRKYDVSCGPPMDSADFATLKWAGVRFDSIFDVVTGDVYNRSGLNSLRVDSIFVNVAEHFNLSGTEDTIVLRIMEVNTAAVAGVNRGLTFAVGQEAVINNNVLWSDSIFTSTGLTSQLATLTVAVDSLDANGAIVANGIHIPNPTAGFIVVLDYLGSEQDTFRLADANNFECGQTDLAVESFVPRNSLSYINYNFTNQGCQDLSGVDDLVVNQPACRYFYRQNMGISTYVTVDAPLSAGITASAANGCPGTSITLNSNASGGEPGRSVTWSSDNTNANFSNPFSETTTVVLPNVNGPVEFYVLVDDGVDIVNDTVIVNVAAVFVDLGSDLTIGCSDVTNLTATVSGFVSGANFLWGANANNATTASVTGVGPGKTYKVTVTNSRGCTATDSIKVLLPITQTLSYNVIQNGNAATTSVCQGTQITFENTSANTAGWTWVWSFGDADNTQSASENPTFTYSNPGTFTITLVGDSADCSVEATPRTLTVSPATSLACANTDTTGINEASWLNNAVSIYPNPTTGVLNVDFTNLNNDNVKVSVFNIVGSEVFTSTTAVNGTAKEAIDMSSMSNGIYFVRVTAGNESMTSKVSVQK